jgi:hypothetical protein
MRQLTLAQEEALRKVVESVFSSDPKARESACAAYADLRVLRKAISRELDRATATLRAHHDKAFEDYDRLKSEGELRISIASPTGFVLGLVIVQAVPAAAVWAVVIGTVAAMILFGRGYVRSQHAQQVLHQHISSPSFTLDQNFFGSNRKLISWYSPNEPWRAGQEEKSADDDSESEEVEVKEPDQPDPADDPPVEAKTDPVVQPSPPSPRKPAGAEKHTPTSDTTSQA